MAASPWTAAIISRLGIGYLELVYWTNRFKVVPEDALDLAKPHQPVILAVWHGQHILLPALRINLPASVMISRSLDGEITARIAKAYGSKPIRASGGRANSHNINKGGMYGYLEMLQAIKRGENVVQTADVPKGTPRRVGLGIIKLSAQSGRPIIPLAVASSRRHVFAKSWDKTSLNLPFGRTAIYMGSLQNPPSSMTAENLEAARVNLEEEMHHITQKAYAIVDGVEGATS